MHNGVQQLEAFQIRPLALTGLCVAHGVSHLARRIMTATDRRGCKDDGRASSLRLCGAQGAGGHLCGVIRLDGGEEGLGRAHCC